MDRLEQIKNEVARENGYKSLNDMIWTESHVATIEVVLRDVARRYATEVASHNLERAAEQNKDLSVDAYESITSLEIELI